MKFIWKIQNFSYLKDGMLQSPSFSTNSSDWQVILYPKGKGGDDYKGNISIELLKLSAEVSRREKRNFSFAFLSSRGLPLIWREAILEFSNTTICNFIEMKDIFGSRVTEFLPNNTLTLECRLWSTSEELIEPLSIFACSRMEPPTEVVKKMFDCKIQEVSKYFTLNTNCYLFGQKVYIMGDTEFLQIHVFYDKNNLSFQFNFEVSMFRSLMKFKILLLDTSMMEWIQFANEKFRFKKKGEVWRVNTNLKKNMINANQNLLLTNDTLSLRFICNFSENVTFNRLVDEVINIPNPDSNQISESNESNDDFESKQLKKPEQCASIVQAMQDVYEEGFLSDFHLRVGDRDFPVHRVILGARSSVFRAMFTTEMKEKEDNFVDVPDVNEDTLQRMLKFVYCDQLDASMGWEAASSLYAAADKYALDSLKRGCVSILMSGLCVSHVLDVFSLADLHQHEELKSAALDFISLNDTKIVGTDRWVRFEEENGKLALETCRKLYLKKMKG